MRRRVTDENNEALLSRRNGGIGLPTRLGIGGRGDDAARCQLVAARSFDVLMSPRLRLIAFAALAGGLLLRTFGLVLNPGAPLVDCDGRASFVMGMSWARGMGFYLDDPALLELCALFGLEELGPAHHFAPGLALIEGSFFLLLGNATLAVVVPLLLISWLAVGAVWWTTRDLFGADAALLAAAAVSLEWTGILFGTWKGFSENLVVIALTLTLWAVLRSLRDDRFILAAGVFAAVGYLSKASMGPFFLIAGFAGLAWRLLFRGRRVLLNGWYWAAIGIFAIPVVVWGLRNISLFWNGTPADLLGAWQTSEVVGRMVQTAIAQPAELLVGLGGKLPILAIGLLLPFAPLLPRLAGVSGESAMAGRGRARAVDDRGPDLLSRLALRCHLLGQRGHQPVVGRSVALRHGGAGPSALAHHARGRSLLDPRVVVLASDPRLADARHAVPAAAREFAVDLLAEVTRGSTPYRRLG